MSNPNYFLKSFIQNKRNEGVNNKKLRMINYWFDNWKIEVSLSASIMNAINIYSNTRSSDRFEKYENSSVIECRNLNNNHECVHDLNGHIWSKQEEIDERCSSN